MGLFSCWADEEERLPRSGRRLDPRRGERRDPLGVYSDDMYSILALHGHPGTRGSASRSSDRDGGFASDDAHPLASVCFMHTAKNMSDAMNSDLGPQQSGSPDPFCINESVGSSMTISRS